MQNSIVMLTFFVSEHKYYFGVNLVQKIPNCQFKLKFGTWTNLNLQNSIVMFTLSVFTGSILFLEIYFKKLKLFVEA